MNRATLMETLEHFDYTGTLAEVLARLSDNQILAIKEGINARREEALLYFGLRRYDVESGGDGTINTNLEHSGRILDTARFALSAEWMRREGHIEVEFAPTPFVDPSQQTSIVATEAGRAHYKQLQEKERRSLQ